MGSFNIYIRSCRRKGFLPDFGILDWEIGKFLSKLRDALVTNTCFLINEFEELAF
jgi:hypothetical protein